MAVTDSPDKSTESEPPQPGLFIERMQESDLDEVMDIERASFSMPWSRQMFETELRESALSYPLVARILGAGETTPINPSGYPRPICGYCVFWHVVDEIHIGNVAVSPKYRKLGMASELIKNIIKLGQQWQVKRITLEVRQSNESAIYLYHKFGFNEVAIRKKYYSHPTEDAIVMVKEG